MSDFSGFTEADIRKVQNGEDVSKKDNAQKTAFKKKPKQKQNHAETNKKEALESKITSSLGTTVQDDVKLNSPCESSTDTVQKSSTDSVQSTEIINKNELESSESVNEEISSSKLTHLQMKHKLMEEQNRIRKELVVKVLEDRTKKSKEEQQKLQEIYAEFKELDSNLSADVKILRKQIEQASYEFMEAERKYNKIEREFLDAKLNLHAKLQRKEMLTEHLSAIIEKNEERKADKLQNLLNKLQTFDASLENDAILNKD